MRLTLIFEYNDLLRIKKLNIPNNPIIREYTYIRDCIWRPVIWFNADIKSVTPEGYEKGNIPKKDNGDKYQGRKPYSVTKSVL